MSRVIEMVLCPSRSLTTFGWIPAAKASDAGLRERKGITHDGHREFGGGAGSRGPQPHPPIFACGLVRFDPEATHRSPSRIGRGSSRP